jgi:hypothetical protein
MTKQNESYELVITGGRVMDPETGLDAVRNVGIRGDKIAAVTEKAIQGKETIDATGHVVCPGFIDMHHHNAAVPFGEKLALRDGITTPLELEAGVYPVDEWYARLEGKCRSNYGASVGTLPVREHVFNPEYKTLFAGDICYDMLATPEESHSSSSYSMRASRRARSASATFRDTWSTAARRQSPSSSRSSPASTGRRPSSTAVSRARCLRRAGSWAFSR